MCKLIFIYIKNIYILLPWKGHIRWPKHVADYAMHNKINLRIRIISSAQAEKVSSPKPQESLCISSSILSSRYKSLSLALKQSQYDSNHSASSSADVQNLARKTAQGRSSSVGIATRYSRTVKNRITVGGEINRTRSYWSCGPPSLLYNGYCVSPGGKTAVRCPWLPTPI